MAGEGDVKLLGTVVSPFAVRVRMALHLKGVSYEYLEQDLFHKGELLLASNPVHKKVPVLIHAGRPVCESLAIVEYVDEVWADGASILPADPYGRAVARFWGAYVDDKLFPAWIGILRAATEEDRAERLNAALAVVGPMEDALVQCSGGKAFFAGDSIGYLDLALGCNLFWFEALREMFGVTVIDAGRTPRLAAWAERFVETEAAKKAAPPMKSMMDYAGKLRSMWAAAATAAAKFHAWSGILRAATEEDRSEKLDVVLAVVGPMENAFVRCSGGKDFFAGDSVGYLDLALRHMFGVTVIDARKTPRLAAWVERFMQMEAAKKAAPPMKSMVEYAMKLSVMCQDGNGDETHRVLPSQTHPHEKIASPSSSPSTCVGLSF